MFKGVFSELFLVNVAKVAIFAIAAILGPLLYRLIFGKNRSKSNNPDDKPNPKGVEFLGIVGFVAIVMAVCVIFDLIHGRFDAADLFITLVILAAVGVLIWLNATREKREAREAEEAAAVAALEVEDAPVIESESDDIGAADGQTEGTEEPAEEG